MCESQKKLLPAESRHYVPPASCRQTGDFRIRNRGRLPHWEIEGGTYFVTFRLGDAVPRKVAEAYRFERENILKTARQLNRLLTDFEQDRLRKLHSRKIENFLDKGIGNCCLREPAIAQLVKDALEYFNNKRYKLYSWCIMPNHVHVVFRPFANYILDKLLHSWKSYTSKHANKLLNRSVSFWQREYYDHLIRNEAEFYRIIQYVMNNPSKAGLSDWIWMKLYPG